MSMIGGVSQVLAMHRLEALEALTLADFASPRRSARWFQQTLAFCNGFSEEAVTPARWNALTELKNKLLEGVAMWMVTFQHDHSVLDGGLALFLWAARQGNFYTTHSISTTAFANSMTMFFSNNIALRIALPHCSPFSPLAQEQIWRTLLTGGENKKEWLFRLRFLSHANLLREEPPTNDLLWAVVRRAREFGLHADERKLVFKIVFEPLFTEKATTRFDYVSAHAA